MFKHDPKETACAFVRLVANKSLVISTLLAFFLLWKYLPPRMSFYELLYAALIINAVVVVAPLIRLAVFPEAAEFAESGGLRLALSAGRITPALVHYWVATVISYAATALTLNLLAR